MAVYDDNNIWSKLRGMRYIVKEICELALDVNHNCFKPYIDTKNTWCHPIASNLDFPTPSSININMMPFIMSKTFEKSMLPNYLKNYWKIISLCISADYDGSLDDKIGFLTIQESIVDKARTQRRPGLHVETPGTFCLDENKVEQDKNIKLYKKGGGDLKEVYIKLKRGKHSWGLGTIDTSGYKNIINGGIYIASSVDDTCAVWNCNIIADDKDREVIGHLGDIEHLRRNLPDKKRQMMKANKLYWISDRTPHEALPMKKTGLRQFFRLVTHDTSIWYEQHSTWNPNGLEPDLSITRIVKGNKFDLQYDPFNE